MLTRAEVAYLLTTRMTTTEFCSAFRDAKQLRKLFDRVALCVAVAQVLQRSRRLPLGASACRPGGPCTDRSMLAARIPTRTLQAPGAVSWLDACVPAGAA